MCKDAASRNGLVGIPRVASDERMSKFFLDASNSCRNWCRVGVAVSVTGAPSSNRDPAAGLVRVTDTAGVLSMPCETMSVLPSTYA
jgi:hypothetical protein